MLRVPARRSSPITAFWSLICNGKCNWSENCWNTSKRPKPKIGYPFPRYKTTANQRCIITLDYAKRPTSS